jgi:hypothetical protein
MKQAAKVETAEIMAKVETAEIMAKVETAEIMAKVETETETEIKEGRKSPLFYFSSV